MPAQSPTLSPTLSAMVAGVVLGDARLHLAHQVGTDIGGLGEDTSTDTHEEGDERSPEAEADEHGGGGVLEEEDDDGGPEQSEADTQHSRDGAGPEGDSQRAGQLAVTRRRR